MNTRTSLQLKFLVFVQSVFALSLASPEVTSAAVNVKNTNYPIPAGAYFVSPDGRDSNSGRKNDKGDRRGANSCKSFNSPCSVEKAIASAPSGATIVFKDGIYRNVNTNINKKLTLQAYPNAEPWLKGSVVVGDWVREGNKWRKDGWNYSFPLPRHMDKKALDREHPMAGNRDMVYVDGVALKQVGSKSRVVGGTFYVDYAKNKLYIGKNPAGKTVEATAIEKAFSLTRKGSSTVIRGLGFAHYADQAILVMADRATLENNTFVWNGLSGIRLTSATNAVLRGNNVSYNAMNGIQGYYTDHLLLENNSISFNNIEQFARTWSGAGTKIMKTTGLTLRNNVVENNLATGIWLDGSVYKSTVTGNTSRNNASIGIQHELSHLGTVSGNLVANNGAGIMLADTSSIQVRNNRVVNNRFKEPIIVKDSKRVNKNKAEVARGIKWVTGNNVIKNNTFR